MHRICNAPRSTFSTTSDQTLRMVLKSPLSSSCASTDLTLRYSFLSPSRLGKRARQDKARRASRNNPRTHYCSSNRFLWNQPPRAHVSQRRMREGCMHNDAPFLEESKIRFRQELKMCVEKGYRSERHWYIRERRPRRGDCLLHSHWSKPKDRNVEPLFVADESQVYAASVPHSFIVTCGCPRLHSDDGERADPKTPQHAHCFFDSTIRCLQCVDCDFPMVLLYNAFLLALGFLSTLLLRHLWTVLWSRRLYATIPRVHCSSFFWGEEWKMYTSAPGSLYSKWHGLLGRSVAFTGAFGVRDLFDPANSLLTPF